MIIEFVLFFKGNDWLLCESTINRNLLTWSEAWIKPKLKKKMIQQMAPWAVDKWWKEGSKPLILA